jgi:hypothetical protein
MNSHISQRTLTQFNPNWKSCFMCQVHISGWESWKEGDALYCCWLLVFKNIFIYIKSVWLAELPCNLENSLILRPPLVNLVVIFVPEPQKPKRCCYNMSCS